MIRPCFSYVPNFRGVLSDARKIFSDVEDITETLEITVFDENQRTKHDFLGKVTGM